jgi:recombination protein RecT
VAPTTQPTNPQGAPGGARSGRQDRAAFEASNLDTLRKMFDRLSKQLEAALPRHITADRMIRIATTTVQRVPKLLQCDPVTVIGAVMQSAQLGLECDNVAGAAYLVPFWNSKNNRLECNLIPGYRGLMMLARRSKEINTFDARCVKKGDKFDYAYGSAQFLLHQPLRERLENPDDVETTAAYAIAFYPGGAFQFHVMNRGELEKAKQFTKSRTREGEITGPWIEHPDAMRQKTVIRRIA